jgi:hypothetical protein
VSARLWLSAGLALAGTGLLALVWWGWQQGGLAFLQLGLGAC